MNPGEQNGNGYGGFAGTSSTGTPGFFNQALIENSYIPDETRKPRLPIKLFIFAAIVLIIIGVIVFLITFIPKQALPIHLDGAKYNALRSYLYYGNDAAKSTQEIEDPVNMYVATILKGVDYFGEETVAENQVFAYHLKELYNDLAIDTNAHPEFKEYDEAIRMVAIYVDPVSYYRNLMQGLKSRDDEQAILNALDADFNVSKDYVIWNILSTNLRNYHESAADLYSFVLQNGCASNSYYDVACMRNKDEYTIETFNRKQTKLQMSSSNAYSDSEIRMVSERLYAMIEALKEYAQ
ncbi:hypothetical protein IJM16_03565 [Candidatus Saccharibacteria bacterium]|nr:hypothetical protein [Candidatus Saccharibacteria bacterium]